MEKAWRKAKQVARIEGQKGNYVMAWKAAMEMLGVPISVDKRLTIGDHGELGRRKVVLYDFDAEYAIFLERDEKGRGDTLLKVLLPISLALL